MKRNLKRQNSEIKFFEGIVKERPDFFEALSCLGDIYTKRGWFRKGLKIDQKLSKLKPNEPIVFYNLACSYSLLGDAKSAFLAIKKAVKLGYNDFSYLLKDPDLKSLRKDEQFKEFIKRFSRKIYNTKESLD